MRSAFFLLAALLAIGVLAEATPQPDNTPNRFDDKDKSKDDNRPSDAPPSPSSTGRVLPPSCVDQCFSPSGLFYGCASNDAPCICTKERRFIDEYVGRVAPCITDRDGRKCTAGGLSIFVEGLQDVCAQLGNPITRFPDDISTWIKTDLWTKYTATRPSEATSMSSTLLRESMGTIVLTRAPASSSPTVVRTETGTPTTVVQPHPTNLGMNSTIPGAQPPDEHTDDGHLKGSDTEKAGLSGGQKVGIGVGVTAVILLIPIAASLIIFFLRRQKAAKTSSEESAQQPPLGGVKQDMVQSPGIPSHSAGPLELEGSNAAGVGGAKPEDMLARYSVRSELQDNGVSPHEFVFELDATPRSPARLT